MTDSPRYKPERDSRISDADRYLHDRLREREAMIGLWDKPRHHFRAVGGEHR